MKESKIFIVDDDSFFLHALTKFLEKRGYEDVHMFENATACLSNLVQAPKVVFLDYNLGSDSGAAVLNRIKRFDPDIYIVFISSQRDIGVAVETLKHGAFDYIEKNEQMYAKLTDVLRRIELTEEALQARRSKLFPNLTSLF